MNYGGGIEYNGDNNPGTTGAGADYVTLYRTKNGDSQWTARNSCADNNWQFRGEIDATHVRMRSAGTKNISSHDIIFIHVSLRKKP